MMSPSTTLTPRPRVAQRPCDSEDRYAKAAHDDPIPISTSPLAPSIMLRVCNSGVSSGFLFFLLLRVVSPLRLHYPIMFDVGASHSPSSPVSLGLPLRCSTRRAAGAQISIRRLSGSVVRT